MKTSMSLEFENDALKSYMSDQVAVLKFKCGVFDTMIDLGESGKLFSIFEYIRKAPEIDALLIINDPQCFNEAAYKQFIESIIPDKGDNKNQLDRSGFKDRISRTREINILNRVILQLSEFKKITVSALQGEVVTPLFGACLACDFRLVVPNTCFCLTHTRYGLHPSGALPFFLSQYLNHGQAMEILLSRERIPAKDALELGLVNQILEGGDFEDLSLQEVKRLSRVERGTVRTTKRLLYFCREKLVDYFDTEMELLR